MIGETILHYKIIEKLGEGGMGIVYKAHDTKLDRTVALKFLPNYLTGDTNEKERFYHEARAAASLTHQNIAVIYEINEYEDKIFLAMEYVEGKTLKKLVEEESESLTIKKMLEIAIQASEGLAAAHEKGIVHRDIKSDNIMLTPKGQVKIMDFGLAKVKGASKLTQAGSTVGTAAYMSPEQAQGEEVDARSDIFSFGIVLYELLTAHLPFRGEHQAALLYSLINEDPPPLARFNDKVTQDLERIVFKAMAKDKDERYQHVDDMMADLRRERKNLEYARAGYAKSSTIAQPVITETKRPDQSQPIKTAGKTFPIKTVIALSFVIILVIAFLIFNPFKVQVTQNSAVAKENNSLAVMYFQNIPDPADKNHTGDMLTNLLITSLSQVKGLDVISRDRLLEIEKDLGQTNTKELSPSLSIKIAKQAGVTTMLTGSILQMSPKLAVTTNLVNVQTGKVIGSQQLTNFSQSQIFNLVDSLSFLIQNALQVSSSSTENVKSVAEVTTKSPEAYRAYVEGLNLNEKLFWKEANSAYERAVNLDPNFAMAYYQLAGTQYTLGEKEAGLKSFQKAVDLAGNATKRERLLILATNYDVQNNPRKAIEAYSQLIQPYPHSISAYISIFNIYSRELFDAQKGNAILREGVKVNPNAKNIWNLLAYSYAYLGNKQDALDAVNKYISLAPAEPNPYDTKGDIYAWFMDYDSSRVAYEYSTSLKNDFDAYKIGSYDLLNQSYNDAERNFQMSGYSIGLSLAGGITTRISLPLVEIEKGQIKNAENKLIEILKSKLLPGEKEFVLYQLIHLCYESSQYSQMLKYAKEVSSELHKNPSDKIYGRDYVAWALVKNGRTSDAEKLVNKIEEEVAGTYPSLQLTADYIYALITFEEGKYEDALQKFKKAIQVLPPNHEPNIFYAICLLQTDQTVDAINELQRLSQWSSTNDLYIIGSLPGEVTYWPIQSVKAHYWLGVAYEQQGKKEKAISEYKKFLDIWKDADFNSPEIKDAKVRLAKLK